MATNHMPRRCWAEIDLGALVHNASVAREAAGGCDVLAVVKADGYGHGLVAVGAALESSADALGVASVEEGMRLRKAGCKLPVLVLGAVVPDFFPSLVEHDLQASVSCLEEAVLLSEAAVAAGKMAQVHLMLDTGMGRIGFLKDDSLEKVAALDKVEIVGVASHYPVADEDADYTRDQLARFLKRVSEAGLTPRWVHIANSAGVLDFSDPGDATSLVRAGLMLYGSSPLTEHQEKLRPALTWKSRISLVRDLPPGCSLSYGRTFTTSREPFTRVATVSVGYGDGYLRSLSGSGAEVLIRGQRCPLLGRVTMDQIMVDVTELGDVVVAGDEVVLLGNQGGETILAAELAERAGTIAWETFTNISQRVTRVYVH